MKIWRIVIIALISVLLLVACGGGNQEAAPTNSGASSAPSGEQPAATKPPAPTQPPKLEINGELVENPEDKASPIVKITGSMPNNCSTLEIANNPPDLTNRILIKVTMKPVEGATCADEVVPFEEQVVLGPLKPSKYAVWLNGGPIADITIPE